MLSPTDSTCFVMKCDTGKPSRHQGSSTRKETSPLFPPLHVNDTGKAGMRAPPRNKMALFEQFTVPYNRCLPSNEGVPAEAAFQQHGTNDYLKTYTHYTLPPVAEFNNVGVGIGKSSYGSSLGSLSTCSAVVNVDERQGFQVQEQEDDSYSLLEPKLGMMSRKGRRNPMEKVSKDTQKIKVAKGVCLSAHVNDESEACEQAVGLAMKGFHKWDKGFITGGNLIPEDPNLKRRSCQEATISLKDRKIKGRPYQDAPIYTMENADASNSVESKARTQLNSTSECGLGSPLNVSEKPVASCQGDVPSMATLASISSCDKMESSSVPPFPAIVKPKHVIHAVGQQLFWKARKAILRQQEVFSNQVFELHKLMKVQKLLAKMPNTLFDEHLLSGMVSDKVVVDVYPVKGKYKRQEKSDKQEKSNKGIRQVPAPWMCEGQVHESRPPQKYLPCEEREGRVVGAESQTKIGSQNSYLPQTLTNAPFNHAHHSSSSDGLSAWGYPMESLNRPFFFPPGAGPFPSGSGYGGAYVVGSNPPMTPFAFPCYTQRPEQELPIYGRTNQWSTPMYHNPFFAPTANDWFGVNHRPLASGSEKQGLTNSVPSINMKAEASSRSVQPAVVPLSRRQQVDSRSRTKSVATKLFGSVATVKVSTPPDALSGKHAVPTPGGCRFMPEVGGAFGGESRAAIEVRGPSKGTKDGAQLPLCIREEVLDSNSLLEKNALKLFPLQPSNSSGGFNEVEVPMRDEGRRGRVIKAIPRTALAASESAAGILLSIQRERQL